MSRINGKVTKPERQLHDMAILEQKGGTVFTVKAHDWRDVEQTVILGIPMQQVRTRAGRGLRHMLGQMYGIIEPEIITADHIFQGLNRAMCVNGDNKADAEKFAYCWTPKFDYVLFGDRFSPTLQHRSAPEKTVFVTLISPNEDLTNYPDIAGWIEHWSWVDACPQDSSKPIEHDERYSRELK